MLREYVGKLFRRVFPDPRVYEIEIFKKEQALLKSRIDVLNREKNEFWMVWDQKGLYKQPPTFADLVDRPDDNLVPVLDRKVVDETTLSPDQSFFLIFSFVIY